MSLATLKDLLVLQAVASHPVHGYALTDGLAGGPGWALGMTRPTVYAALRRLTERGCLETTVEPGGARPDRQVHRLTDEGRATYDRLLARQAAAGVLPMQPLAGLLLHLDALEAEPRAAAIEELVAQRRGLSDGLEELVRQHQEHAEATSYPATLAALDLMQRQLELELEVLSGLAT